MTACRSLRKIGHNDVLFRKESKLIARQLFTSFPNYRRRFCRVMGDAWGVVRIQRTTGSATATKFPGCSMFVFPVCVYSTRRGTWHVNVSNETHRVYVARRTRVVVYLRAWIHVKIKLFKRISDPSRRRRSTVLNNLLLIIGSVCLCHGEHASYFLSPCDKRKHTDHAHQQAASQASTDSAWRHPVWLPHSSLGFQRPVGRRSYFDLHVQHYSD